MAKAKSIENPNDRSGPLARSLGLNSWRGRWKVTGWSSGCGLVSRVFRWVQPDSCLGGSSREGHLQCCGPALDPTCYEYLRVEQPIAFVHQVSWGRFMHQASGQQAQADFDAKAGQNGSVAGWPLHSLNMSASRFRRTLYVSVEKRWKKAVRKDVTFW